MNRIAYCDWGGSWQHFKKGLRFIGILDNNKLKIKTLNILYIDSEVVFLIVILDVIVFVLINTIISAKGTIKNISISTHSCGQCGLATTCLVDLLS